MIFLVIVLFVLICIFEFVNGFHDTANAVATVIYTKSLKPTHAVVYSGIINFLGVVTGGVAVAYSLVKIVPLDYIQSYGIGMSVVFVLSLLLTSIVRNLCTWQRGIPCSSSHTLIGSLLGAVAAFMFVTHGDMLLIHREKIKDIGLGLLISPLFGFGLALILVNLFKKYASHTILFHRPMTSDHTPPRYIRTLLITTCGLVSYFHGSNDGQKGIGISMIILALCLPSLYGSMITMGTVPLWVILVVSLSLGIGTMIGWKRVVVMIGEKIGKTHLSYIQGACAEAVAALTIGLSTGYHLPVSTTHTLSSGVAGAMVGDGGHTNLNMQSVKSIAYAWVLTLPICIVLSGLLVILGSWIVL